MRSCAILGVCAVLLAAVPGYAQFQNGDLVDYSKVERLRWMGPGEPGTYEEYQAERSKEPLTIRAVAPALPPGLKADASPPDTPKVLVIVNSALEPSITERLGTYIGHLIERGYNAELYTCTAGTAEELKAFIQANSQDLIGCVFVGDIPAAWYEVANDYGDYGYASFPCDLFLTDLDGLWSDADDNGLYDAHTNGDGTVAPEIFIGRIDASRFTHDSEANLTNAYFDKLHTYYSGRIPHTLHALTYTEDDWAGSSQFSSHIAYAYTSNEAILAPNTSRDDYALDRLPSPDYDFIQLSCHSSSRGHYFTRGGVLYNNTIWSIMPQALYYNLFCCSACRFTDTNCLAASYIFNASPTALTTVGSTKTGSMLVFLFFYASMGNGNTIGMALQNWFSMLAPYSRDEVYWHYGMIVLGDPMVTPCDPPTAGLVVEPGAAAAFDGPEGGPFSPSSVVYTITNLSIDTVDWTLTKTADWLNVSKDGGTLASGASDAVEVTLNASTQGQAPGVYTDVLTFTDTTHEAEHLRDASLEIREHIAFSWSPIASEQATAIPFAVTVRAIDTAGGTVRAFDGTVTFLAISDVPDTAAPSPPGELPLDPTSSEPFVDGVWTGNMAVLAPGTDVRLIASHDGLGGISGAFDVVGEYPIWINLDATAFSFVEHHGTARITVALSEPPDPGESVSVSYSVSGGTATAGADFVVPDGTLVFNHPETHKIFEVAIVDDGYGESDETAFITLSDPVGGVLGDSDSAAMTIIDNDRDTDGDGLTDYDESAGTFGYVTDPLDPDTDNDGADDGLEIRAATNPLDPAEFPVWRVDWENASGQEDGRSWATAFTSIQDAVDYAAFVGGGDVWVAEGTYTATTDPVLAMADGIPVYGGFVGLGTGGDETAHSQRDWRAHTTVIDGEGVRRCVVGADDATLDGFWILRGSTTWCGGAGMTNTLVSPVVTSCVFAGNTCSDPSLGAGAMANLGASPVVSDCVFYENAGPAGALANLAGSAPAITRCVFSRNTATIGGGAVCNSDSSVQYVDCRFVGNSATTGGAFFSSGRGAVTLSNSVFMGNTATTGGALYTTGASKTLTAVNCTLAFDSADLGAALYNADASSNLVNCILWGDCANTVANVDGTITVTHSDVSDAWQGEGVLCEFPRFARPVEGAWNARTYDPHTLRTTLIVAGASFPPGAFAGKALWANGTAFCIADNSDTTIEVLGEVANGDSTFRIVDWHLQPISPCVDTGANAGAPSLDLDGDLRPCNAVADMGADEYNAACSDSDQDGIPDDVDVDDDGDGLPDATDPAPYDVPPRLLAPLPELATTEGVPVTLALDPYAWDAEESPATLRWFIGRIDDDLLTASIDADTHVLTVTPTTGLSGSGSVFLMLLDSSNQVCLGEVHVIVGTVNDPPAISSIPSQRFDEDTSSQPLSLDDYVEDPDHEDAALLWTCSGGAHITATIDPTTRELTLTAAPDWCGLTTVTLRATDPEGLFAEIDVNVAVLPVNDDPWIGPAVPTMTVEDDVPLTCDLSAYAHDIDNEPVRLTWTVAGADESLFTASLDAGGTVLTLTPVVGAMGTGAIELTLRDGLGGATSQLVAVTVTPATPPGGPGDVDWSGDVDAVDVQLVINDALGTGDERDCDVNCDGHTNAVDVQLAINAALGLG